MLTVTVIAGLLARSGGPRPRVDFGAPMVSTEAGASRRADDDVFRGFESPPDDALMLAGLLAVWSLALAAIVASVLLNSMDSELRAGRPSNRSGWRPTVRSARPSRRRRSSASAELGTRPRADVSNATSLVNRRLLLSGLRFCS